jgi:hypothetical protein
MKTLAGCTVAVLILAVATTLSSSAQSGTMDAPAKSDAPAKPLLSPAATAETTLAGKSVVIHYNSPSLRGRKMIGEHDAYDKVWRTGANPATTLITATDLKIGKLDVPAGTYTIYSLPEAPGTPWQLIINKQTGQWGTVYKPEMDLGRTPMKVKPVSPQQEAMSITFENVHGKKGELHVRWADVDEYVKIEAK